MTSIQKWLGDVFDDALPVSYVVRPYPYVPDAPEPGRTYVSVYRTSTEPAENAQGARRHELDVVVLASHQDPARADEALADGLDAVLDVIDHDPDLSGLTWTSVERGVVTETFPAMTISTWCITRITEQE